MKKTIALFAASLLASTSASAANLVLAKVTGPSGTEWDTEDDGNYTLFLQQPGLGDFLNPNDEAVNDPVTLGSNRYLLAGDGFRPGEVGDSDLIYTVSLTFADGAFLTGTYTPLSNVFVAGSTAIAGGLSYTLNEFSFRRNLGDSVSQFSAVPGDDGDDYSGNFRFTVAAVPEPASWAMMLIGFGVVGTAMRRRPARTQQLA